MDVEVVTAPEYKYFHPDTLKIFLAGGICNCVQWQDKVIDFLKTHTIDNLSYFHTCILNPRRTDWLDTPGEATRQIEWGFDMIERCDMFTMYFAGGESDQPICMYELGRNILRMQDKFPYDWRHRIVITCDSSYKRLNDVLIQVGLATEGTLNVNVHDGEKSIDLHCEKILEHIPNIMNPHEHELW